MIHLSQAIKLSAVCWLLASLALPASVSAQVLSPMAALPGDALRQQAVEVQERPDVAAGGDGYLVVWHDSRSAFSSLTNNIGTGPTVNLLQGNMRDVFATRLSADGSVLDDPPLILSSDGYNQARPRVAFNGTHWLVVWIDDQADYDTDIVAVRVAPDGQILDDPPIVVRAQAGNSGPGDPVIASDGNNWLVVWPEFLSGVRGLRGTRVAPDGTVLDNPPALLRTNTSNTYANNPDLTFANGRYALVWIESSYELNFQQFAGDLSFVDGAPVIVNAGVLPYTEAINPSIAANGTDYLVTWWEGRYDSFSQVFGARVNAAGVVLDPLGIELTAASASTNFTPDVTWDGSQWLVAFNRDVNFLDSGLLATRVAPDGTVLDFDGVVVSSNAATQFEPQIVARPGGGAQLVWVDREVQDDVRSAQIDALLNTGTVSDVSMSLPRQSHLRFASSDAGHMAVFISETSAQVRLLAQRVDRLGTALDMEPTEIASGPRGDIARPDIAWNGSIYLVVWEAPGWLGTVVGVRLNADGTPIDLTPLTLMIEHDQPAVAALGDTFLIAASHEIRFHEPVRYMQTVRVAPDGSVLDAAPVFIRGGYALDPDVVAIGGQWLVVWEAQLRHDSSTSSILGAFVSPANVPAADFPVSGAGLGDDPALALNGSDALVVWGDNGNYLNDAIEGRLLGADGIFRSSEFVIADVAEEQTLPRAAWNGTDYIVTWMDYRDATFPMQPRADVYAARVAADGIVRDPNGFALITGPLPEDYAEVAAANGASVFGFSSLLAAGAVPEVQRIGVVALTDVTVDSDSDTVPDSADNCMLVANPDQRDTNGDSIGNQCDTDLNNDCTVNTVDLGMMKVAFFSADADADSNGDGIVNVLDLAIMKLYFFLTPGPSGIANLCDGG